MTGEESNRFSFVPGDDHAIIVASHPVNRRPCLPPHQQEEEVADHYPTNLESSSNSAHSAPQNPAGAVHRSFWRTLGTDAQEQPVFSRPPLTQHKHRPDTSLTPFRDQYQAMSSGARQEISRQASPFISRDEIFFDAGACGPSQHGTNTCTQSQRHGVRNDNQILSSPLCIETPRQPAGQPLPQHAKHLNASCAEQHRLQGTNQPLFQLTVEPPPNHSEKSQPKHTGPYPLQHGIKLNTQPLLRPQQTQKPSSQQPEQSHPQCTDETRPKRAEEVHLQRTGKARAQYSEQPFPQRTESPHQKSTEEPHARRVEPAHSPHIERPHPQGTTQPRLQRTAPPLHPQPKQPRSQHKEPPHPQKSAPPRPTSAEQPCPAHTGERTSNQGKHQPHPQHPWRPHVLHPQNTFPSHSTQKQKHTQQPDKGALSYSAIFSTPHTPYTRAEHKTWINSVNTQNGIAAAKLEDATRRAAMRESYGPRSEILSEAPRLLRRSSSMNAMSCEARPSSVHTLVRGWKAAKKWLQEPVGSPTPRAATPRT